ncbi:MAG: ABC transporter permease, partial [Rhodothermales bacterium]|nr:ABC transporter permease [Rhodothermales bacterium]
MLRNYLLVAVRALRRRPGYAALNVAGLGLGLACCLLIGLWIHNELSYDRFHAHADRVVRITSDWGDFSVPATSWPVIEALRADYPDVEIAHITQYGGAVQRGEHHFREEHILYANAAFFDVFGFELARGDEAAALAEPYQVVLSARAARKYFGDADPVGQPLRLYDAWEITVAGVLAEPPGPSHIVPDLVISWPTLDAAIGYTANQGWGNNNQYTYLLLPPGVDAAALEADFPAFIDRHAGADWNGATLALQPLTSIHLHSDHDMELTPNGRAATVWLFGAVALFILLLAGVNFTNLATARALDRAREVGVRKSLGARQGQVVRQFLAEAVLLALGALGVAAALAAVALPALESLSGADLAVGVGVPAAGVALG